MVIIRANGLYRQEQVQALADDIRAQADTGVIVLPCWCELLSEVPMGEEIQIIQQREDTRVAELEKELAQAMAYITAQKECKSCAHNFEAKSCEDEYCENCPTMTCPCRSCNGYSNWKWRGAHESV